MGARDSGPGRLVGASCPGAASSVRHGDGPSTHRPMKPAASGPHGMMTRGVRWTDSQIGWAGVIAWWSRRSDAPRGSGGPWENQAMSTSAGRSR